MCFQRSDTKKFVDEIWLKTSKKQFLLEKLCSLCCIYATILKTELKFFTEYCKIYFPRFQQSTSKKRFSFWVRPRNLIHSTKNVFEKKWKSTKEILPKAEFCNENSAAVAIFLWNVGIRRCFAISYRALSSFFVHLCAFIVKKFGQKFGPSFYCTKWTLRSFRSHETIALR